MTILAPRTMRTRSALAGLMLISTAGALVAAPGSAAAAGSADLSVTQTVSGSATSGHTGDTIAIHNSGPDVASTISAVLLIRTTSNSFGIGISGAPCQFVAPPPGYQFMLTCQSASLGSGGTLNLATDLAGQVGVKFTLRVSVGEGGPGDPTFANNSSVLASYFGPRADLAMTQTAPVQSTSGKAEIVTTVLNKGPNTASSLQLLFEIKSATFSSVLGSSNQPSSSCAFTPPQAGFDTAVSCTLGSLTPNSTWIETLDFTGGTGAALMTKATITAVSPIDPVPSNNTRTKHTRYA